MGAIGFDGESGRCAAGRVGRHPVKKVTHKINADYDYALAA